ncbi:methyl-CpG-binding domain protein 4 [Apostasia shenzhenica]|uniref:Methyl-CpG-binding domain protein 4 n=1 Tax=Apostasia shenzhenica TaxID=1088818 RepID=A0A2I0B9A3_9ASPA|nr:methyl-CpG-binding domain protein 4 [Apostasia shenzhenica]
MASLRAAMEPLQSLRSLKKRERKIRADRFPVLALPAPIHGERIDAMRSTATALAPSPAMDPVEEVEGCGFSAGDSCIIRRRSFHFLDKEIEQVHPRKWKKSAAMPNETRCNPKKKRKISYSAQAPALEEMASAFAPVIAIPEAMGNAHPNSPSLHLAASTSINENVSSSTMAGPDPSLLSASSGSISTKRLESFEQMLKSFVYTGKRSLSSIWTDTAAIDACAISTSNGKMASSGCPRVADRPKLLLCEESVYENRAQQPIFSLDRSTSAFEQKSSFCTTYTYRNIADDAGQEDEACQHHSVSTLKNVKRKHQSASGSSPDSVLVHGATSLKSRRRITPFPSGNDADELQDLVSCKRAKTMTKAEKMQDAYRRVSPDNEWIPPHSPYELLQEDHAFDPWRVLVICMLLNQTTGTQVKQVLEKLFRFCPNAEAAAQARKRVLRKIIKPLGLQNKRAKDIREMSRQYLEDWWTHVTQLHGVGKYAADAYAIFCVGKPEDVIPEDHKLVDYWNYVIDWRREQQSLCTHY